MKGSKIGRKVHPIFIAVAGVLEEITQFAVLASKDEIMMYFEVEFQRDISN